MKPFELNDNARAVLSFLSDGKTHPVAEVAEHLSIDRSTARKILQRHYAMAFVDERKQDSKSLFRITSKGRNALGETRAKTREMPSVPKPGEVVPFLRALSESLTMMADRLEEYDG